MTATQVAKFSEIAWESREFDWMGKSFYFIPIMNILGKPIGLGKKMVDLNNEVRRNGYKALSTMMLIQYSTFKGRIMIEVEKQDKYDSQVITYDDTTTVDTIVHKGRGGLGSSVKRLQQRVASRRGMPPRTIYYWLVSGIGSERIVLLSFT